MRFQALIHYAAAALLLAVPLFGGLGDLPVQLWDESRLMINSWEMYHNREFFILHFNGQPDLWNTKPPLVIWMQTASIGLFGFDEFALRFPSALCALLTCLALVIFFDRILDDLPTGLLAGCILATMPGFNGIHVARTADFDAPLMLFLTLSALFLFRFLQRYRGASLFAACLFTAAAVLTKGIAGLMFLPGLFVYLAVSGNLAVVLKSRAFHVGILAAAALVGGYYGWREILEPGYLAAVWENEIGGRYFRVNEGHSGSIFYYVRPLLANFWVFLLPAALWLATAETSRRLRRFAGFSLCLSIVFFMLISLAKTKLVWYAAPLYPFLAALTAAGLAMAARQAMKRFRIPAPAMLLPLALLFILPVMQSVSFVQQRTGAAVRPLPPGDDASYVMSRFLKSGTDRAWGLDNACFVGFGYQPHIDFYLLQRQWEDRQPRRCNAEGLSAGRQVLFFQERVREDLGTRFDIIDIRRDSLVHLVRLEERR